MTHTKDEEWIRIEPNCILPDKSTVVQFRIKVGDTIINEVAAYHIDGKRFHLASREMHTTYEKMIAAPGKYEFFWKSAPFHSELDDIILNGIGVAKVER